MVYLLALLGYIFSAKSEGEHIMHNLRIDVEDLISFGAATAGTAVYVYQNHPMSLMPLALVVGVLAIVLGKLLEALIGPIISFLFRLVVVWCVVYIVVGLILSVLPFNTSTVISYLIKLLVTVGIVALMSATD